MPLGEGRRGGEFFQGPACPAPNFQPAKSSRVLQAQRTGKGDHGSVVCAILERRPQDLLSVLFQGCRQPVPQPLVRANSAGYHQVIQLTLRQRALRLRD